MPPRKPYLVTLGLLMDLVFDPLKEMGREPTDIFIHPVDYADVRKFGRDALDVSYNPQLIRDGLFSHVWMTPLRRSRRREGVLYVRDDAGDVHRVCLEHAQRAGTFHHGHSSYDFFTHDGYEKLRASKRSGVRKRNSLSRGLCADGRSTHARSTQ